ncbi:MAG TPA: glycosyltransferase family 9 protein [Chryseolinea sp.]
MNFTEANHIDRVFPLEKTEHARRLHRNSTIDPEIRRILICRPNHRLGNLLLITPLIQELAETFPECEIDLFVRGHVAPELFKNYQNIGEIIKLPKRAFPNVIEYAGSWMAIMKRKYDLVIDVDKGSSSGRLSLQLANGRHKISGDMLENLKSEFIDYEHHAKFPIYNFRNYLARHGFTKRRGPVPSVNLKLNAWEIAAGRKLLRQMVQNEKKTICLFTYATGNKCYSELWWTNFYNRLRYEFPAANIIEVLPVQNISKLAGKAPTFYSKDVREIGSLIANTDVFIGADSGIMHLANAVQTPTVGLFSVSNQKLYAPYGNNSVAIDTNVGNTDECIHVVRQILYYRFIQQGDLKIITA